MKAFPANVCGNGCKRLRGRLQTFASEKGKTGIEIVSPVLDKRKDGSIRVTIAPRKILLSLHKHPELVFRFLCERTASIADNQRKGKREKDRLLQTFIKNA